MTRAVSIHIGVNDPQVRCAGRPLKHSERAAWRMAELADQAGYDALLVLRGREATRNAVEAALAAAARTLARGDTLLVSFSGHGSQERDVDGDEGYGWDEAWCLYDGVLLDDKLAGFWMLFEAGVRIVVVAECCFSAGSLRNWDKEPGTAILPRPRVTRSMRSPRPDPSPDAGWPSSCIGEPPHDAHGIRASLLLLAASTEEQTARDGLYTDILMEEWKDGAFQGTYCDLHARVRARVMATARQEPQIMILGAPDRAFPLETAFHLDPRRSMRHPLVLRRSTPAGRHADRSGSRSG